MSSEGEPVRATGRTATVGWRHRVSRPALPPLEQYAEALEGIWDEAWLSNNGPWAQRLEAEYEERFATGRAVLCAGNGDLALTLALAALELPRGATAVLPSLSYPSAVHAAEWNGLRPRFVDVSPEDWCVHPEQLADALSGAGVVIATHMFGVPCEAEALELLAAEAGVKLVFDAAHAVGAKLGGRHVTAFGDASVVSLSATKPGQAAEGGLAVFAERAAAERFAVLRNSGMGEGGVSVLRGLNAKLSELHAALGVLSLSQLDAELEHRRALVAVYRECLTGLPGVRLQEAPGRAEPCPTYVAIAISPGRERVRAALAERGIEARCYFPALHLMERFVTGGMSLPVTEQLDRSLLALPLYGEMSAGDIEDICTTVCEIAEVG